MSIFKLRRKQIGLAIGALAISVLALPASAGTGCNNVVNWLVWFCAPWDNNNGPKYPYYRKEVVSVPIPKNGIRVEVKDGHALAIVNGQKMPLVNGTRGLPASVVAAGGGNVVAAGGGNVVAAGGGNIVSGGAGNLQVWSQK